MSQDDDWFSAANLDRSIEKTSAARRADAIACLAEFVQEIWIDNTEEEAREAWERASGLTDEPALRRYLTRRCADAKDA